MNTRISPLLLKQEPSAVEKKKSIFRIGAKVMETILSLILAIFAALVFMWLNGKQHEFDRMQDKSK